MSVNIRIPSNKGDTQLCMPVIEAKKEIDNKLKSGWIVAINNRIEKTSDFIKDEDNVILLPRISGG